MSSTTPVTAATALFPQYVRAGFRPMLHLHETALAAALAEAPPRELLVLEDRSLGALLVAVDGPSLLVAMIGNVSTRGAGGLYFGLPKGHPNAGEDDASAAIREVYEEVGVDVAATLDPTLYVDEAYTYTGRLHRDRWEAHAAFPDEARRPFAVMHKTTVYFLAVLRGPPPPLRPQEGEAAVAEWVPVALALDRLGAAAGEEMRAAFAAFLGSAGVRARLEGGPVV
jgi:8-oxo-dGTP pyrophosphatase MutT (NUDIX family)